MKGATVLRKMIVDQVSGMSGVEGLVLTDRSGTLLGSTLRDQKMVEYLSFMAGILPMFEQVGFFDQQRVKHVMVRSPSGGPVMLFVTEYEVLGVLSSKEGNSQLLKRNIEKCLVECS